MTSAPASSARPLEVTLRELIDVLELPPLQQRVLVARWLDQVVWAERASARCRSWYYALRLTTVAGGVTVPALVTLIGPGRAPPAFRWVTFGVSLLVALTATGEEVFQFGRRWRQHRATAELLKSEGWEFASLTGTYARFDAGHAAAYPEFAARVEAVVRDDVQKYLSDIVSDRKRSQDPSATS